MGKGGDGGEENMAAWLVAVNTLKIQPFKLPPLGPHEVRVRMKAVGICGSDVHYLKTMSCAHFVVKEPMVIGHECAGVIEELGSEVKSLTVGDRVALEPGISCMRCKHCKGGRYNLCPEMKFFATPPVHGSLANQIVHPADLCFKLPDNVSLEEGAMCEPLSVGVHACRRALVGPETNVLIMGAGPIGLVTMLSARAFGSPRIIVVDIDDYRLSVAKSLGADDVVKVSTNIQACCKMFVLHKFHNWTRILAQLDVRQIFRQTPPWSASGSYSDKLHLAQVLPASGPASGSYLFEPKQSLLCIVRGLFAYKFPLLFLCPA